MRFFRTYDLGMVHRIVTNPACWPRMANDAAPERDKFEVSVDPNRLPILVEDDDGLIVGLFLLVPTTPHHCDVHFCLLPSVWGRGEEVGRAFLEWAWENTGINELTGNVPSYNLLAMKLAEKCGFIETGASDDAGTKNGTPFSLSIMKIERPV